MKTKVALLSVLLQVLWFGDVSAAVVELVGTKVTYRFDSVEAGLLNHWSLSNDDALHFFPTELVARSPKGEELGLRDTSQNLVITVIAKPGFLLNGASLLQEGIYSRWGMTATELDRTSVNVAGSFTVDSNTAPVAPTDALDEGQIGTDLPKAFGWSVDQSLLVAQASSVTIKLSTVLFALSSFPTGQALATIQNDLTRISALVQAVPVDIPSSLPLLGTAILAVALVMPKGLRNHT